MNKFSFFGYVYFVTIGNNEYVVKVNHLDQFVALMSANGPIVVSKFVKSKVIFDNVHQWYKTF